MEYRYENKLFLGVSQIDFPSSLFLLGYMFSIIFKILNVSKIMVGLKWTIDDRKGSAITNYTDSVGWLVYY